eukprot:6492787-Amphidinium_carterae.2
MHTQLVEGVSVPIVRSCADVQKEENPQHIVEKSERAATQNSVHATLEIDGNEEIHRRGLLLYHLGLPLRAVAGQQNKENRSADESVRYWSELAAGGEFQSLVKVFSSLQKSGTLRKMRFDLTVAGVVHESVLEQYLPSELWLEQDWIDLAVELMFNLVHERCKGLMLHWQFFPGTAAGLLHSSPVVQTDTLRFFAGLNTTWESAVAASVKNTTVYRLLEHSFLNTPAARVFMGELRKVDFMSVPPELKESLRVAFSLGQSKIQEDSFRLLRQQSELQGWRRDMSLPRKWMVPIQQELASTTYKYNEVKCSAVARTHPDVSTAALPTEVFHPLAEKSSIDMKSIVGPNATSRPTWPTFNAASLLQQRTDLVALEECRQTGQWQSLETAWLSLLCPQGVLFRRKTEKQHYFSLGSHGVNACVGWPAVSVKGPAGWMYYPRLVDVSAASLRYFVISNPDDFLVQPLTWRGPLWLEQQRAQKAKESNTTAAAPQTLLAGMENGLELDLMAYATLNGLFKLPASVVQKLAAYYGMPGKSGDGLYEHLCNFVSRFLPNSDDESKLRILQRRLAMNDDKSGVAIDSEVWSEVVDAADAAQFEQTEQESARKVDAERLYTKEVNKLRHQIKRQYLKKAAGKAKAKSKRKYTDDDDLTQDEAKQFFPPTIAMGKDLKNRRWWARDEPFSISRSFSKYTSMTALALCVDASWVWFGEANPHDWSIALVQQLD